MRVQCKKFGKLKKTLAPWYPHVDDELGGT